MKRVGTVSLRRSFHAAAVSLTRLRLASRSSTGIATMTALASLPSSSKSVIVAEVSSLTIGRRQSRSQCAIVFAVSSDAKGRLARGEERGLLKTTRVGAEEMPA